MFLKERISQAAMARKIVVDHFAYTALWNPLGALATTAFNINITSDSDFCWMATTGVVFTAANNLDPAPDMLVQYMDTGSNRNLQDFPMHWSNVIGTGQWPYMLPEPKLLIGGGGIQITAINLVNAAKGRIDITLVGVKIFYIKGYSRDQLVQGI
jgi:hypothetical protein